MVSGASDDMSTLYISRTLRLVRVPSQIPSLVMEEAVLLFIKTLSPATPLITAPKLISSALTAREVQFHPEFRAMVCSMRLRALRRTGAANEPQIAPEVSLTTGVVSTTGHTMPVLAS